MDFTNLPAEVFHAILDHLEPNWQFVPPTMVARDRVSFDYDDEEGVNVKGVEVLSSYLIRIDDIVIRRLHANFINGTISDDDSHKISLPTAGMLAMGTRLLKVCVLDYYCWSDQRKKKAGVVMTIVQGAEAAVKALSGEGSSGDEVDRLRWEYIGGLSAVMSAQKRGTLKIEMSFGSREADVAGCCAPKQGWRTEALMAAAYLGRLDHMQRLIALGLDIEGYDAAQQQTGWISRAIGPAAYGGQVDALRLLERYGVDLTAPSRGEGNTAVHFSALGGPFGNPALPCRAGRRYINNEQVLRGTASLGRCRRALKLLSESGWQDGWVSMAEGPTGVLHWRGLSTEDLRMWWTSTWGDGPKVQSLLGVQHVDGLIYGPQERDYEKAEEAARNGCRHILDVVEQNPGLRMATVDDAPW
ncbi:hypothetical protein BDV19DRAFT_384804 [Aspergillus venezuelensis]